MPKAISTALKEHLAGTVTTLATLWTMTRTDGVVFYLTDHDASIVFGGQTFLATSGYQRTAIQANSDLSVNNLELTGIFDNTHILLSDLRAGKFDFADVRLQVVNWADLAMGSIKLMRGTLGSVASRPSGMFQAELRGMTQRLAQKIVEVYTPDCRADLGDSRCKIPIEPTILTRVFAAQQNTYYRVSTAPSFSDSRQYQDRMYLCTIAGTTATAQPTYNTAPGDFTTDGDAQFQSFSSWMRTGVVATVTDAANFTIALDEAEIRAADRYFAYGILSWETGGNSGRSMESKAWTATGQIVQLFLPMDQPITVGDRFRIAPGCDKLLSTCFNKFSNVVNMRGEPYLMGNDALFALPNQA